MSTFAVFGMTRDFATAEAKKKTPATRVNKSVPGGIEYLTDAEWLAAVDRAASRMMEGAKVKQLSPLFDAPQFAEQFIQMARKSCDCRDMQIKAKRIITDAAGKPLLNKKTKAPKVGFCEFRAA